MKKLGKLEQVRLRDVWKHEAHDFTQWMGNEENISHLLDEISITAENIITEDSAGKFNVDITADEVGSGKKIIIENQLEKTDHDHLGKLLTYASSFDASIIVWVVAEVRDEHKRAIEWFNEHMIDEISFFLVKTEVWQIGDSEPAVKFNVVVEPNSWAKYVGKNSKLNKELTSTKLEHLSFWEGFKVFGNENKNQLRITRKPFPQHWYDISIGKFGAHIALTRNTQESYIGAEIYIHDDKDLFNKLFSHKDEIEEEIKEEIYWEPLEEKKASRIRCQLHCNTDDEDKWNEYYSWLISTGEKYLNVFKKFS